MKTLLLNGQVNQSWIAAVREAVGQLGSTLVVISYIRKGAIAWSDYELIILDAGSISDLMQTIKHIHQASPRSRIAVFSSAPQYKQARDIILAGASYYESMSLDVDILSQALGKALGASN